VKPVVLAEVLIISLMVSVLSCWP